VQAQDSANQAGLVILHGDGRVVTACVTFTEPQISGLQLLERAGLDINIEANSTGGAVCRINGEGCGFPQQSCFCRCEGPSCTYWSYWRSGEMGWQYSNLGAGSSEVRPGQVDGWVWGPGTVDSAGKPPVLTLADVCRSASATSTPAPTAAPSVTPPAIPSPTATVVQDAAATPPSTATAAPTLAGTPLPVAVVLPAPGPPRIEWFAADRADLALGEAATLRWRVVDAASVTLLAGGQAAAVDAVGSTVFAPPVSVELRLEARNNSGVSSSVVQLVVRQPLSAAPAVASPTVTLPVVTPAPAAMPPVAVVPSPLATQGTTPAAVSLMLPLVMQDSGRDGSSPGTVRSAADAQPAGRVSAATIAQGLTVEVVMPAATAGPAPTATPTPAPGPMPGPAPTALVMTEATTILAATAAPAGAEVVTSGETPNGGAPEAGVSLVWVALAAIVVLPGGIGTLGYLAWRFVNRNS
jgi:hypothetical protein